MWKVKHKLDKMISIWCSMKSKTKPKITNFSTKCKMLMLRFQLYERIINRLFSHFSVSETTKKRQKKKKKNKKNCLMRSRRSWRSFVCKRNGLSYTTKEKKLNFSYCLCCMSRGVSTDSVLWFLFLVKQKRVFWFCVTNAFCSSLNWSVSMFCCCSATSCSIECRTRLNFCFHFKEKKIKKFVIDKRQNANSHKISFDLISRNPKQHVWR